MEEVNGEPKPTIAETITKEVKNSIGGERFEDLSGSLKQLVTAMQYLILLAEQKEKGSGQKLEVLIRGLSDNLYGHASSQNGSPEKVIKALEEFIERTNFA